MPKYLKIAGGTIVWMAIVAVAFAAFLRSATGTVTASTTSPGAVPLTLVGPLSFSDAGQTTQAEFKIVDTDANGTYQNWSTGATAGVVSSGPCAGFITIPAGQTGALYDFATGGGPGVLNGNGDEVYARGVNVHLDASAPQSCANQASIPLQVSLDLS